MVENNTSESEFNSAMHFINRTNQVSIKINYFRETCDAYNWLSSLTTYYSELTQDMKEAEIDLFMQKIFKLNNTIKDSIDEGNESIPSTLYNELLGLEIDLKKIFKRAGYHTKYKQDFLAPTMDWDKLNEE